MGIVLFVSIEKKKLTGDLRDGKDEDGDDDDDDHDGARQRASKDVETLRKGFFESKEIEKIDQTNHWNEQQNDQSKCLSDEMNEQIETTSKHNSHLMG